MDPQDDPEARIRDLERPLSDQARASELGREHQAAAYGYIPPASGPYPPPPPGAYPPPPPGAYPPPPGGYPPTTAWDGRFPMTSTTGSSGVRPAILIPVVIAVLAFVIAGGVSFYLFAKGSPDVRPNLSGGGATTAEPPIAGGGKTQLPSGNATAPPAVLPPPGGDLSVSGIEENKTIACNDSVVSVSGVENTVVITGHCVSLTVSGFDNVVTVDSADSIGASGFDNRIVFRTGVPEVSTSGSGNTVEQG